VAQKLCAYLARKIDADGGTTCIYWAVGPGGSQIEVIGDLTADQAEQHIFGPPRDFGTGTQLLPAVKYFVDRFKDAPWGFYVFITDGELHDLDAVKAYSTRLAKDVEGGRRRPLKFVLIGVGPDINETQMEELDDLDTGTSIDLWDHKLAAEMRVLQEIFAEVIDQHARVADNGRILDPHGRCVKNYSDTGLPGYLEFEMPTDAAYFTLEVNGRRIHQGLFDRAQVPASDTAPPVQEEDIPSVLPADEPRKPAARAPQPPPILRAPEPAVPAPAAADDLTPEDDLWKSIDLKMETGKETEVDLDSADDKKNPLD
jgi:hypothetical protein